MSDELPVWLDPARGGYDTRSLASRSRSTSITSLSNYRSGKSSRRSSNISSRRPSINDTDTIVYIHDEGTDLSPEARFSEEALQIQPIIRNSGHTEWEEFLPSPEAEPDTDVPSLPRIPFYDPNPTPSLATACSNPEEILAMSSGDLDRCPSPTRSDSSICTDSSDSPYNDDEEDERNLRGWTMASDWVLVQEDIPSDSTYHPSRTSQVTSQVQSRVVRARRGIGRWNRGAGRSMSTAVGRLCTLAEFVGTIDFNSPIDVIERSRNSSLSR